MIISGEPCLLGTWLIQIHIIRTRDFKYPAVEGDQKPTSAGSKKHVLAVQGKQRHLNTCLPLGINDAWDLKPIQVPCIWSKVSSDSRSLSLGFYQHWHKHHLQSVLFINGVTHLMKVLLTPSIFLLDEVHIGTTGSCQPGSSQHLESSHPYKHVSCRMEGIPKAHWHKDTHRV